MDIDVALSDNTALFKARLKMLKMKGALKKTLDEETKVPNSDNFKLYAAHSRQIAQHIRELRDLVLEKRKSYLLSTVNVYGHDNFMSDSDRKQCDDDTETAMKQCSRLIRNLEVQVESDETLRREDEYLHLKAVAFMLSLYLENVCRIVSDLRASQLKKTQHLGKICRLGNLVDKFGPQIERMRRENERKRKELQLKKDELDQKLALKEQNGVRTGGSSVPGFGNENNGIKSEGSGKVKTEFDCTVKNDNSSKNGRSSTMNSENGTTVKQEATDDDFIDAKQEFSKQDDNSFGIRQRKQNQMDFEEEDKENYDTKVDPVFLAQLTVENDRIYDKFTQRTNEIEMIESQFAEVQKLQRTFAEKVVEQERDIEIIHDKTIHTLENLEQANDFIREAIKNSASRRVIALFCLIVLTLVLLFVDWYNA
ncbi:unnamed protein product [Bursaphelenchus okinawaensis]|uniref:Syntaxin-18 n=1 Tax=Bursaphelenchus okinawaensis TaxID=465554 RepID=A0A811LDZ4_9BILA|nr:unnamed protein product [Bursaphelenchus okinawaensis]CAG9120658.1 unnamed protein product [Bursaphelenchus okinawaensis]